MNNPFKLLDSYGLKDRKKFYGRDNEINALYHLLQQSQLTLIYGASGVGKTSLINAGLPKIFKITDWFKISIRRKDDINDALCDALGAQVGRTLTLSDVTQALHQVFKDRWLPIYLVFDQFEEIFTLGEYDERLLFFNTLQNILHENKSVKVILSMREEYIGHLYEYEHIIPNIFEKRFRVESINDDLISTVIYNTCCVHGVELEYEENTARLLKDQLKIGKHAVYLPHLQIYLYSLYEKVAQKYDFVLFTDTMLQAPENSLAHFLKGFILDEIDETQAVLAEHYPDIPPSFAENLLNDFASKDGTSAARRVHELAHKHQQPTDTVQFALHYFDTHAKLLRADENEPDRYEVVHDIVAQQIHEGRSVEEKAYREFVAHLRSDYKKWQSKGHINGYLLKKEQLLEVELYLMQVQKELDGADLEAFYEKSKLYHERVARRERERIDAEKEQIKRNRILQSIIAIGLLLGIIIIAGTVHGANNEITKIENKKIIAQDSLIQIQGKVDSLNKLAYSLHQKAKEDSIRAIDATKFASIMIKKAAILTKKIQIQADSARSYQKEAFTLDSIVSELKREKEEVGEEINKLINELKKSKTSVSDMNELYQQFKIKLANIISDQAKLALKNDDTNLALRLAQAAMIYNETDSLANDIICNLQDYIAISFLDVETYRLSSNSKYIAISRNKSKKKGELTIYHIGSITKPTFWDTIPDIDVTHPNNYSFSIDNKYLIYIPRKNNKRLILYSLNDKKPVDTLYNTVYDFPKQYSFSEDGKYLAYLKAEDKYVDLVLYSIEDKSIEKVFREINTISSNNKQHYTSFQFSPRSSYLAFSDWGLNSAHLNVYRLDNKLLFAFKNLSLKESSYKKEGKKYSYDYNGSFQFSEDEQYLIFLTSDNSEITQVAISEFLADAKLLPIFTKKSNKFKSNYSYKKSYSFIDSSHFFILNKSKLLLYPCVEENDSMISLENIHSSYLGINKYNYQNKYRFSESGNIIAYLEYDKDKDSTNLVYIPDTRGNNILRTSTTISKSDTSSNFKLSKNGKYVTLLENTNEQKELKLLLHGKPIKKWKENIIDYCFSSDNQFLFLSNGKKIDIYDIKKDSIIRTLEHQAAPISIEEISAQGKYLITTSEKDGQKVLKITNPYIPQDSVMSYYDKVLPLLSDSENWKYIVEN